jgi:hypothetical protein
VRARTDFAGLEASVDETAAAVAKHLEADRAVFIGLLDADLAAVEASPGAQPVNVAVAARLLGLDSLQGVVAVAGAMALVQAAEARYRDALTAAVQQGGARAIAEAAAQGADTAGVRVKLGALDEFRLDLAAQKLAQGPHADVIAAAADAAYRVPDVRPGGLRQQVIEDLRQLSPQPLLGTLARPVVQQADTIGRAAAMVDLPKAASYYASELLDKRTCTPCHDIDGREYPTIGDARVDYPAGGYRLCEGGDRCRGTIVAVWQETPPGG